MIATVPDREEFLSIVARSLKPNAIRGLTPLLSRPDIISFAAGAPSIETFPIDELAEIAAKVIKENPLAALQYGPTRGLASLIEAVAGIMVSRGIAAARTSQIQITSGSQQGLDLIARIILDPGDVVLVELPSYVGGIIAFQNSRAELVGVNLDDDGLDIDDLRKKIKLLRSEGRCVKCIYTISNFQNPSGVTLAEQRRHDLASVAEEHELLIIEDDPYHDLYFGEKAPFLTPLAALCPSRVVYLSSFSKILAPGLRMAWMHGPEEIISKVELAKEASDLSSSQLDQSITLEAIRSGLIERRLPVIREFYATRCNAMLQALKEFAPAGSRWSKPAGGFFIWLEAPESFDSVERLPNCIANGVAYVPGQPFCVDGDGKSALRLAFSKETAQQIRKGIQELCKSIRLSV